MLNQDAFLKRLETVIQYYDLSASALADKIGVQRSSISHLLTGRNKPSLEFVLKVVHVLPEVNLYWLLQGEGEFPSKSKKQNTLLFSTPEKPSTKEILQPSIPKTNISKGPNNKTVERIVFFYSDGSFESYSDKKE
ncbi:helix-turn-helix transcriptional regulator [Flavobacteriaceae bacterium KMM 6897]|nr:helix-turn-helix transcriptional regulator [Flavobacteriaceae bacterium KMM 6897]